MSEQPTAPYLDAVAGYGFRGSGRFHVPGHKGGPGADPGPAPRARRAARWRWTSRRTSTASTSAPRRRPTSAPSSSPPQAYGARRSWFLTNGATQGNHALCLALAPLGATVVAQRNSHASVVDGLVLSGGLPAFVAPEYDAGLGMAHGVTPQSLAAALAAAPQARAAFIVSPTYYGMADRRRGLRRRRARGRRAAGRRPVLGPAPRLPRGAAAERARAGRRRRADEHAQARRLAHPERDAAPRRAPTASTRARSRATVRIVRSTSPSSLLLASLDAARRQLAVHGEQLLHETLQAIGAGAREAALGRRGRADRRGSSPAAPASPRYDPLRIVLDVRGTGCTGVEIADGAARALRRPRRAGHAGDGRLRRRHRRARRDAAARRRRRRGGRRAPAPPGRRRRRRSASPRARRSSPSRRATRSSASPRSSPSTTPSGASPASRSPATRRASRRCCPASASAREIVAYLRESVASGAAPARRQRPARSARCTCSTLRQPQPPSGNVASAS